MLTEALVTKKYLSPSLPTFWRWSDDGEAVTNAAGETLCFRVELADALEAFDEGGLPPLGAVVLALDARTRGWENRESLTRTLCESVGLHAAAGRFLPPHLFESVAAGFESFHETVKDVKDPAQREAALRLVFDGCVTEVPGDQAGPVVAALRVGPPAHVLAGSDSNEGFDRLLLDLRALDAGLARVTPEALRRFTDTGVEADVLPIEELDVPDAACDAALAMIDHLCADEQHAALGRLTRDLLAALRLPRGLGQPRDLPLGGLSDITNRGQLDRLLISELAQDDLTLAVRVASNEALYLRREEGRTRPPISRQLIVDVGLRQWGVPRLIGAAAALALCAGGDTEVQLACHHTTHAGAQPADPLTPAGLETLLGKLELNLTPAAAIAAVAEDLPDDGAAELVVITHTQALKDPGVTRALAAGRAAAVYLVAIDADGRVELVQRTAAGSRTLAKTKVDPDKLLDAPARKATALTDPSRGGDYPAAVRQTRLPLRVPHQFKTPSAWFTAEPTERVYVVTGDRRLTMWDTVGKGPVQLADNLPSNRLLWCAAGQHAGSFNAPIDAIIGHTNQTARAYALSIDPDTLAVETRLLDLPTDQHLCSITCHRGTILVVGKRHAYALDPLTGQVLAESAPFSTRDLTAIYAAGRFFRDQYSKWHGINYDGTGLKVLPLLPEKKPQVYPTQVSHIIEPDGLEDTVVMSNNGAFYKLRWPDGPVTRLLSVMGSQAHAKVSHDGRRVRVDYQTTSRGMAIANVAITGTGDDCKATLIKRETNRHWSDWIDLDIHRLCQRRSPRVRFERVEVSSGANNEPHLKLYTRKAGVLLHMRGADLVLSQSVQMKEERARQHTFKQAMAPSGTRYTLAAVDFGDAGRLVLDSRGMLHLQPGDDELPEVTLILDEYHVSGWCADGRVFGDPYYHLAGGHGEEVTAHAAYERVIRPILRGWM